MAEDIRQKLIRQGKLVDEWGRKIEDNAAKRKRIKRIYSESEVVKIIFIIGIAEYLLITRIDEIIIVLNYMIK